MHINLEKGTNPILIDEIYRDSKLNGINVYKLSYYTCSDKIVLQAFSPMGKPAALPLWSTAVSSV